LSADAPPDKEACTNEAYEALRWLVGVQTSQHGQLRPIGSNGFYRRNGARADFDQQPIEAQTTVSACLEAYRATADPWWYEQAQRAFDWFLGWNDLGLELYAARPAAAAMGCTRTGATKTRERNRCWPSSCRRNAADTEHGNAADRTKHRASDGRGLSPATNWEFEVLSDSYSLMKKRIALRPRYFLRPEY
jgi:hypothetical protein